MAVLLLIAGALWFWLRPSSTSPPDEDEDINEILAVANPGYVGIETCAECHTQRAAAVRKTRHYLACRPAAAGVKAPGFAPGRGRFTVRTPGLHFEMTRLGDEYFVNGVHATAWGEQRASYQIGLVYGSGGKRDEMYFAWQDDRLYRLPVAWLYPYDCWGAAINTVRGHEMPPSCLECHNTWITHIPGTPNQYRRDDMLLGVTCERCHGPGREHVAYHREHPDDDAAHAIVHPGTLSRDRLMDVCGQCHANTRPFGRVFSYRPGEPLETSYRSVRPKHPEDDTTNQVRYLSDSKCFRNSEMTCITCHDPHRTRSAERGCRKCHTPEACPEQPRLPEAVRGDCVGCHMPSRIPMHAHFYTTDDDEYLPISPRSEHHIGVYPEAKEAVLLAWLRKQTDAKSRDEASRLAAQLTQHWVKQAEQRSAAGRLKAAIGAYREALRINSDPDVRRQMQEVVKRQTELDDLVLALDRADRSRPDEAVALLHRMLEIKPDYAFAHSQLGNIYAATGKRDEAVEHFQAVAKCDPNDSYGVIMLAWMAYLEGRFEEAETLCARAEKIDAGQPMNYYLWGMALAKQQRWAEAEKQFRNTLAINPTHGGGNQGLSEALRHQGQAVEAVRYARRAVRWGGSQNAEALLTLADAYTAAKRPQDARRTLDQALRAAEASNRALVPTVRERLCQLR